jgi:hypothetical protein
MQKPKRVGYNIFVVLFTLVLIYAGFAGRTEYGNISLYIFFTAIAFGYLSYWRLYLIYKIEKIKGEHNRIDFIDYFDNDLSSRWWEFVLPLPIHKKQQTEEQDSIKYVINLLTVLVYASIVLLLFFALK